MVEQENLWADRQVEMNQLQVPWVLYQNYQPWIPSPSFDELGAKILPEDISFGINDHFPLRELIGAEAVRLAKKATVKDRRLPRIWVKGALFTEAEYDVRYYGSEEAEAYNADIFPHQRRRTRHK